MVMISRNIFVSTNYNHYNTYYTISSSIFVLFCRLEREMTKTIPKIKSEIPKALPETNIFEEKSETLEKVSISSG